MKTTKTKDWQPKVASLVIPALLTCIIPVIFFSSLSIMQIIGSGLMLSIIILSLVIGEVKELPNRDITILWIASILYGLYLLSAVL